jgi:fructuronate reductase
MPQDGLYSVLERGRGAAPLRVAGSVREVLFGAEDPVAVVERIADPAVRLPGRPARSRHDRGGARRR